MNPLRVAIFASGTGSNAQALIQRAQNWGPEKVEVSFVLSDKASAPVLEKAKAFSVRSYAVEKNTTKQAHEQQILHLVKEHQVDWIFLAGYMRLLSASFLSQFSSWHGGQSQVVNIHPSLLPLYPGVDSIARAYQDRVPQSGVTIHLVDEGMDTGTILQQEVVRLLPDDPMANWAQRIHQLEHHMYTKFLDSLIRQERRTFYFQENI